MRDVAIIGVGIIPFGRRDEDTLMEMLAYASLKALDDAGLGDGSVDAVVVGNMGGGIIQHQTSIASSLVDRLSLLPAAAETVENGPASGGSAVKTGLLAVASVTMTRCWWWAVKKSARSPAGAPPISSPP